MSLAQHEPLHCLQTKGPTDSFVKQKDDWIKEPAAGQVTTHPNYYKIDQSVLENLLGQPVVSYKFSPGSKDGDNIAGSLRTASVTTNDGKEYEIIFKFLPNSNRDILSYMVHCKIMDVENEFYKSILGDMREILLHHNLDPESLPFPKHYGGGELFVALEDLRPSGYKMADKYRGLDIQQVSLVMKVLAQFHALSYFYIRQSGEKIFQRNENTRKLLYFPWKPEGMDPKYFQDTINLFSPVLEVLKNSNKILGMKLEKLVPEFFELFPGIFNRTDRDYFPVICHGDLWLNNILFKGEKGRSVGIPSDVRFIDLQQVHRGNVFEDLLHFFVTSTTRSFREKHLLYSLNTYYRNFVDLLKMLQCPTPAGFTLGFLIDHYFDNLRNFAVFVGGTIAFHLGGSGGNEASRNEDTDNEAVLSGECCGKTCLFLKVYKPHELTKLGAHYSALEGFCKYSLASNSIAIGRFVDVIEEFDRLGVLD